MRLAPLFVFLTGCVELVADDAPGHLVQVAVRRAADDCTPARLEGDGGLQFFAARADGGLVFTMSQQVQFGPLLDGGSLESVQRQTVPAVDGGAVAVGFTPGCAGTLTAWEPLDGGLRLTQDWPGRDGCPSGPAWLPARRCTTTREFALTPVAPCSLRCVEISASGDVRCGC